MARWRTSSALALVALAAAGCGQAGSDSGGGGSSTDRTTATTATTAAAGDARLVPSQKNPFQVKGTGFVPHERVQVAIVGRTSRAVSASDGGSFRVTFPGVSNCDSVTVTATGSKGSRASFNLSQIACVEP